MPLIHLSREHQLIAVISISMSFFILEIVIGFMHHSLALVADAFHVCSDLVGFVVALVAIRKAQEHKNDAPKGFSFGWQRAELLGAFFNGVFLLALGLSIFLQTIERFIQPEVVTQPELVLIVGGVGLGLNLLNALMLGGHGHDHGPRRDKNSEEAFVAGHDTPLVEPDLHKGHAHTSISFSRDSHDLGILGVVLHLLGDAINNVAVIISAAVILTTRFYYADPIASLFVGAMIIATAWPLTKRSGRYLLESAPAEIDICGVESDVERVKGVDEVHEVHVWSLTQSKRVATMHVATSNDSLRQFMETARSIRDCLHHWGVHNITIQPELVDSQNLASGRSFAFSEDDGVVTSASGAKILGRCQVRCIGGGCEDMVCCT